MTRVIDVQDIMTAAAAGQRSIDVAPGTRVTNDAVFRARELHIDLNIQGQPQFTEIDLKPNYFGSPAIDNLYSIVIELAAAVWVLDDRLHVIEDLLDRHGVVSRELIDGYEPDPERAAQRRSERDAFINRIFGIIKQNPG